MASSVLQPATATITRMTSIQSQRVHGVCVLALSDRSEPSEEREESERKKAKENEDPKKRGKQGRVAI